MKKIITIGGSTSKNSINKQLAEYAGGAMNGVHLTKLDLNDYQLPLYSIDVETEHGFSQDLQDLNQFFGCRPHSLTLS